MSTLTKFFRAIKYVYGIIRLKIGLKHIDLFLLVSLYLVSMLTINEKNIADFLSSEPTCLYLSICKSDYV